MSLLYWKVLEWGPEPGFQSIHHHVARRRSTGLRGSQSTNSEVCSLFTVTIMTDVNRLCDSYSEKRLHGHRKINLKWPKYLHCRFGIWKSLRLWSLDSEQRNLRKTKANILRYTICSRLLWCLNTRTRANSNCASIVTVVILNVSYDRGSLIVSFNKH